MAPVEESTAVRLPSTLRASGDVNVGTVHSYIAQRDITIQTIHHIHPPPAVPERPCHEIIEETVQNLEKLAIVVTDFRKIHMDIIDQKTDKTGQSYMRKQEVQDWFGGKVHAIWITGGAGAGKTYIASSFIERSEELAQTKPAGQVVVIYAYLRYTEKLTTWDIVLSMIIQLVQSSYDLPAVSSTVRQLLDRHNRKKQRPSLRELIKLLKDLVKLFGDVRVVFDGLDEMFKKVQWEVLEIFSDLQAHVVFTSRPSLPEEDRFKELVELCGGTVTFLEFAAQDEDLKLFINHHLSQSPSLRRLLKENDALDWVVGDVMENANGMFLHAALQVEALQSCITMHDVKKTLQGFPRKIEDLYSNTLQRIKDDHGSLPRLLFMWLLHAEGNITIEDLQHVAAVAPETFQFEKSRVVSQADMLAACCGIVVVERSTRRVRFIHYTAYEVLSELLPDITPSAAEITARTCIARLLECGFAKCTFGTVDELNEAFDTNPFLEYAWRNWPFHLSRMFTAIGDLQTVVADFVSRCESFPYFSEAGENDQAQPNRALSMLSPIHVASLLGIRQVFMMELSRHGVDPNLRARHPSGCGATCLMIAAEAGHHGVVEILLGLEGLDVNLVDPVGSSALLLACRRAFTGSVELLCAVPTTDVNLQNQYGKSPLSDAVAHGRTAHIKSLVATARLDVNQVDQDGWSALMLASDSGEAAAVQALLSVVDVNVDQANKDGNTAYLLASWQGHIPIVKMLITIPHLNRHHVNQEGETPLHLAARGGHDHVVQILLAIPGTDINQTDLKGYSPLANACLLGREDVVKTLLATPGVDINGTHQHGYSPFLEASCQANPAIVEALIKAPGIDFRQANNWGETALHLAVLNGHDDVVRILIDLRGMDFNQTNDEGETPLTLACFHKREAVAVLLLTVGEVDVNRANHFGNTPLLLAAWKGSVAIVEALIAAPGIDWHHTNKVGSSPLHLAAECDHEGVLRVLLQLPGVDINSKDLQGESALTLACIRGCEKAVEVLVAVIRGWPTCGTPKSGMQQPISPKPRTQRPEVPKRLRREFDIFSAVWDLRLAPLLSVHDNDHVALTPQSKAAAPALELAAEFGNEGVLRILLTIPGVNINHTNERGQSILTLACLHNREAVVAYLLANTCVNVNHKDYRGNTPLHLAASNDNVDIVSALLNAADVDVECVNESGETALHVAIMDGCDHITRIFLGAAGIDVNRPTYGGETPLLLASARGNVAIVEALINVPDIDMLCVNTRGESALHLAASSGHDDAVRILSLAGMDVNQMSHRGETPFLLASLGGHLPIIKILLAISDINLYSTNNAGASALHLAAQRGHVDVVRFLLDLPGMDVNQIDDAGNSPLAYACLGEHEHVVQMLLSVPDVDVNLSNDLGRTPLHQSAIRGTTNVVAALLKHSMIDIHAQTIHGLTPAMYAACIGCIPALTMLLDHPAATIHSNAGILLAALSVSLYKYDGDDWPPEADKSGDITSSQRAAGFLLEREEIRRLAHTANKDGWTALMLAAKFGYFDIVRRLLAISLCARTIFDRNRDGNTAFTLAFIHGHRDVVEALSSASFRVRVGTLPTTMAG